MRAFWKVVDTVSEAKAKVIQDVEMLVRGLSSRVVSW